MDLRLSELEEVFAVMESYDPETNESIKNPLESLESSSQKLERLMEAMESSPVRAIRKGTEEGK